MVRLTYSNRIFPFRSVLVLMACLCASLVTDMSAADPINLAGVYEGENKINGETKRMYLDIDFINGTQDFTQKFTEKKSDLKYLPADFMNAKKLKTNWRGQTAPGFMRFNDRMIFSTTLEAKIYNPTIEDGVIVAKWEDSDGKKGDCHIIVNPDGTLQILGIGSFYSRELSPDNLVLVKVKDGLQGREPYVTPPAISEFLINEYNKSITKPKVISFDSEIEMQVLNCVQKGNRVEVEMRLRNKSKYESLTLTYCYGSGQKCEAIAQNGEEFTDIHAKAPGSLHDNPAIKADKGKWASFKFVIENVNERVDYFKSVKIDFAIAGGFFVENPYTVIENLPVLQDMPESLKASVRNN